MGAYEEYIARKAAIDQRLSEFSKVLLGGKERIFYELCFCLLTPQSRGKRCWEAAQLLQKYDFYGRPLRQSAVERIIRDKTRFHKKKAACLLAMKMKFDEVYKQVRDGTKPNIVRLWLADWVNGIGLKEASHFLRNIGYRDLAILDRHVLKHMVAEGVLPDLPHTLTPRTYFAIEERFRSYSQRTGVPMDCLDLVFWSMETGEVFK